MKVRSGNSLYLNFFPYLPKTNLEKKLYLFKQILHLSNAVLLVLGLWQVG